MTALSQASVRIETAVRSSGVLGIDAGRGSVAAVAGPRWIWIVLVLAVCHAAVVASFQILSILVGPIRSALSLTDVQYSLAQGLAVAIFASLLGIPAATVSDRGNRRLVVLVGVVTLSASTLACAFVRGFGEFFVARMLVGLGEAFFYPSAMSMIADVTPAHRLSTALGVFGCGGPIGAATALMGGGWLVRNGDRLTALLPALAGWRIAFVLYGAFGCIAAALLLTVAEPEHRVAGEQVRAGIAATLGYMGRYWKLFAGVIGGMITLSFCVFATASWAPAMLVRSHGMSYGTAGALTGSAALVAGVLGAWSCGMLSDRIERLGCSDAVLRVSVGISLLFLVAIPAAVLAGSPTWIVVFVWLSYALLGMPTVVGGTALQQISPPPMRAQVMAIQVLLVNFLALSLGPLTVAALADDGFGNAHALGTALAVVVSVGSVVAGVSFLLVRKRFCRHRIYAEGHPDLTRFGSTRRN